jgi:DNA ligase 1
MKAASYIDKKTGKPLFSVSGLYMSEKYDGQRAQWDPKTKRLLSRYNNVIQAPEWFLDKFKDVGMPLDGELFFGYGKWDLTGIFRAKSSSAHLENADLWKKVKYMVFDIPDTEAGTYLERRKVLKSKPWIHQAPFMLVESRLVESKASMEVYYNDILKRGGEGLMFNNPVSFYRDGRTDCILKYKPVMDDECIIVGYKPGKGRNTGKLGSFIVHPIEDGCPIKKGEFSISGVSDMVRSNYQKTHPLGTVLRYCCYDYTKCGKPRHPSYLGKCKRTVIREDVKLLDLKAVIGTCVDVDTRPVSIKKIKPKLRTLKLLQVPVKIMVKVRKPLAK